MKTRCFLPALCIALLSPLSLVAVPKIGVLLMDRESFWAAIEKGAIEAGKAANVELVIKAPIKANAPDQQMKLLGVLEQENLDVLVVGALPFAGLKEPLARFAAKGVKIVAVDTPLPGLAQTYLGYNQKVMSETAARLFNTLIKDGDEVAILRANSLAATNVRERTFIYTVKTAYPNITMYADVMAGAIRGDDFKQCNVLLDRHPGIKAVCTPFTSSSMAMLKALKERNLSGRIIHLGFGIGLPEEVAAALEAGTMQGWIAQEPRGIGSKGIEIALDLIAGKSVPATNDAPFVVVTKANLHDPAVEALKN